MSDRRAHVHLACLSPTEALGLRSKQALNRWLKKKAKGETEEIEDAAFDNRCGRVSCNQSMPPS